MIELIRDKEKWCEIVASTAQSDFYHTYDYHHLSKNDDEDPVLIVYREGKEIIALPLLFRMIPGTEYKDATSVYGYAGPLSANLTSEFDNSRFRKEFIEFLQWNNVVTVFSRLNPFIPLQKHILQGIGITTSPGKIVNIDLTKGDVQLWSEYNRRLKSYINKSKREYRVIETQTDEVVRDFIDMYYGNMRRVNAQERYFFKEAYFFDLLKSRDFETKLLMASNKSTGKSIGGAMFIKKGKIVQYHLSGARESALDLNPIKLLIDEMRREASCEGYTYFNLGGGVGNQEDSLFRFKAGFSKNFKDFMLWKFVVDEKAYIDLVHRFKSGVCERLSSKCSDFFPCYRCELV